jgi:hypothetical protein
VNFRRLETICSHLNQVEGNSQTHLGPRFDHLSSHEAHEWSECLSNRGAACLCCAVTALCLDPVLSGTDAVMLADRSVAHHMRLLLAFSNNGALFYTHSPSEPMLALGASSLLYDTKKQLPDSLKTLSIDFCGSALPRSPRNPSTSLHNPGTPTTAHAHPSLIHPISHLSTPGPSLGISGSLNLTMPSRVTNTLTSHHIQTHNPTTFLAINKLQQSLLDVIPRSLTWIEHLPHVAQSRVLIVSLALYKLSGLMIRQGALVP